MICTARATGPAINVSISGRRPGVAGGRRPARPQGPERLAGAGALRADPHAGARGEARPQVQAPVAQRDRRLLDQRMAAVARIARQHPPAGAAEHLAIDRLLQRALIERDLGG
ncbi:MAG TPA: hypothetical protein PKA20_31045, partial [Burkholderiaceae bacterium]|nr:hypothetical protein [Burkholderiaceae bacterium]